MKIMANKKVKGWFMIMLLEVLRENNKKIVE